eukprot:CAMPEP_0197025732 /NCGR_PEP_ID=MMETSP1384-20130603/5967_1 /TAXON_ID=29189 /ORGANISM="Ammonia sp." /LENGTH=250 /DNA_ID=CAMNT_0042454303 /DNA_START=38 /DNA_END=790 /DNA_ORIENTATION=+
MATRTSLYYTLLFLLVLLFNTSTVHASIGEITFARLASSDKGSLISFAVIYSVFYWTPIMFTVYMVDTRSTLFDDERALDKKWYRWSNQYAFHELMFRTQIVLIMSLVIIFSFEPGWTFLTATSIIGIIFGMCFMSKCISFLVEPRILTTDEKQYFYRLEWEEERQSMHKNSQCPEMKRQRSRIIKSRHRSIFQQFSFKKKKPRKTKLKTITSGKQDDSHQFELRTPLLSDSSSRSSSAVELSFWSNEVN